MKGRTSRASAVSVIFFFISIAWFVSACSGPTPTIPTAAPTPISNPGRSLGNPNAPVIVEVFMDFQCPACKNFSEQIAGQIIQTYVEAGKVYYVFRHFPFLDDNVAGNESDQAANASMCAEEQNHFWEYHDILFTIWNGENQNNFTHNRLLGIALGLGLDIDKFSTCFIQNNYIDVINSDIEEGMSLGVKGTPAILINRKMLTPGFVPTFEDIYNAIESELAQTAESIELTLVEIEPTEILYPEIVVDKEGTGLQPQEESTTSSAEHVNTVTVGNWEIALIGSSIITDFNGALPEEGHKFIALNLNLLNRSDIPILFWPDDIGVFKAIWEEYTYRGIGFDTLEGYIPPGWPISVKVIFDLPAIVEDPIFTLTLTGYGQDPTNPILLNDLGSQLDYEPPVVKNLGEKIEIPNYYSFTPTGVRSVLFDSGNLKDQHAFLLDTSIKNLYGHDISANDPFMVFQLFSEGMIIPVFWGSTYYQSPWFSPPPTTSYDPSEHQSYETIAPGFVREGSFQLNIWEESPLDKEMFLLISIHNTHYQADSSGVDSAWALYKLGDSATDSLKDPISPPDNEDIALNEAQMLIDDGNLAAAAIILGKARLDNPGNTTISKKLEEVQQETGEIIFQEANKLISRKLGSMTNETSTLHEILDTEQYHQNDLFVSPDGSRILVFDSQYRNNVNVVDKNSSQVIHLVVEDTFDSYSQRRFLSWSPSSDRVIMLDDLFSPYQNLIIIDVDKGTTDILARCEAAPVNGLVAWSPTGDTIAYFGDRKILTLNLDTNACSIIHEYDTGFRVDWWTPQLGWSSDGNFIYFGSDHRLNRINLTDFAVESLSPEYGENVNNVVMEPGGRNLIYTVGFGSASLFDTKTGQIHWIPNEIDVSRLNNWIHSSGSEN